MISHSLVLQHACLKNQDIFLQNSVFQAVLLNTLKKTGLYPLCNHFHHSCVPFFFLHCFLCFFNRELSVVFSFLNKRQHVITNLKGQDCPPSFNTLSGKSLLASIRVVFSMRTHLTDNSLQEIMYLNQTLKLMYYCTLCQ